MAKWKIDPTHTSAEFKVKHLGISWVRGQIFGINGDIDFDPSEIEQASFEGTVDVKTLTTGNEQRDGHLMSPDFFNVEEFPEMRFKTLMIADEGESKAKITGQLTIHGVTKEVELKAEFQGVQVKPNMDGSTEEVAGFMLSTKIDRRDFDLTWNVDIPGGNVLIGNDVEITVDIEAVKQ